MKKIKTLKDIKDMKGKKVLLRVDFNVPLKKNGDIQDDTRMVESIPTIKYLQKKEAKIIIVTHLGRPDGEYKEEFRLTKIAEHLEKLLSHPVKKLDTVLGNNTEKAIREMKNKDIIMLENIRCEKGEEECDPEFTRKLAALGEIFVSDAFGTAHRKHASTAGLADYLPAYAGILMEKEIAALSPLLEGTVKKPLVIIFGGAKIDTKIGIIRNFFDKADHFLIGGALANTFLAAAGYNIGYSLYEKNKLETAREIMLECEKHHEKFVLPHDVIVSDTISNDAETANVAVEDIAGDMRIMDIGKWSAEKFCNIIQKAKTVIWNGPLGLCEYKPFRNGTKTVATFLAKHPCTSIIGGGDTNDALKNLAIPAESFTHISTGGGATLEYLSGTPLPGIEILQ